MREIQGGGGTLYPKAILVPKYRSLNRVNLPVLHYMLRKTFPESHLTGGHLSSNIRIYIANPPKTPLIACIIGNTSSSIWSLCEKLRKWWTSRRSRGVYLFQMYLEHDGKHLEWVFHITSQSHGQTGEEDFVFNFGTHYSNGHLVIHNKIYRLRGLRLEIYVTMFLLAHYNNVLIIFY